MNVQARPADAQTHARPASPADALAAVLREEVAATEAEIARNLASPVGLIPDVAHHLVDAGGKRLRPLLTLASARACGVAGANAVKLAAAVEYIHTATLLHDDVVDGSSLRRGKRAANLIWGDKASVLVGDFLFARAFNLMVQTGSIRVLDILAHASSVIAEGEVLQLAAANSGEVNRDIYMKVVEAKTAALFRAACEAGAITGGGDDEQVAGLARFGRHLGLAFQFVDDALDYGGATDSLGKNVGDDFREGKVTLPVIIALERAQDDEPLFWQRMVARKHREEDLDRGLAILRQRGAIDATLDEAREQVALARAALAPLKDPGIVQLLGELADYVVARVN
ncbi:MAG: polyprenyl synthetase family protein [Hyphomonadaceae bacterium]|nr:polyprenyl synthetase family protein [Hyphomonadaceae bacterium]